MAKTVSEKIVENAEQWLTNLQGKLSSLAPESLGVTAKETANGFLESINTLLGGIKTIESETGTVLSKGYRIALNGDKNITLPKGTPLTEATSILHDNLETILKAAKDSHAIRDINKALDGAKNAIIEGVDGVDGVEKVPNFVSRHFFETTERFDKYLSTKSLGGKLGIAATGIVLGGILMQSGGTWLSQGLDGQEPYYSRQADNSTLAATKPMSTTKRTAKILGGVVAGITGIGAEIVGMFTAYKAFIG